MPSKYIIFPSLLYGFAWYISAWSSFWGPAFGFIILLLGGLILGIALHIRKQFLNILVATFFALILGAISGTGIGLIVSTPIIIYFLIKKWSVLVNNRILILCGFCMYVALLILPNLFHHGLSHENGWLDFVLSGICMAALIHLLDKFGYDKRRVILFTIGLPGFLFLFKVTADNSPFTELSGN